MENLNYSFPGYYFNEKYETNMEVDIDEKNNSSALNVNSLKIIENFVDNINVTHTNTNMCNNTYNISNNYNSKSLNFYPKTKKSTFDISYSIEQTFCENSHINIEEEFQQNEETYLKIGNEGQNPCIDPVQEVDSFEREDNESFLHENNYLFDFDENNTNSFENGSSIGMPSELFRSDLTLDENEINKMRKNIMSLKLSKSNLNLNKSDMNNINKKKAMFAVSGSNKTLNNSNCFNQSNNNSNNKLNLTCNISLNFTNNSPNKKRGRKKFLFDGVKIEIIDKAYIRDFRCHLKRNKHLIKTIYDELKSEEKLFWNEFLLCNNPPFYFTHSNNKKIEYKSFSKSFLKFVFSHTSVRHLYNIFIQEKGKEIVNSIINKKIKKIDRKMLLFYSFYGKNLHKFYSNDYSINDINLEELEGFCLNSSNIISSSTTDSITIVNTSMELIK